MPRSPEVDWKTSQNENVIFSRAKWASGTKDKSEIAPTAIYSWELTPFTEDYGAFAVHPSQHSIVVS